MVLARWPSNLQDEDKAAALLVEIPKRKPGKGESCFGNGQRKPSHEVVVQAMQLRDNLKLVEVSRRVTASLRGGTGSVRGSALHTCSCQINVSQAEPSLGDLVEKLWLLVQGHGL